MNGNLRFFISDRSLPFLIVSIITKNIKNLYVETFNYFALDIHMRSNCYELLSLLKGMTSLTKIYQIGLFTLK